MTPDTIEIPPRIDYDKHAATDEARIAVGIQRAHDHEAISGLRKAAKALINDVRRRHPGEALTCPHMRALDAALVAELEIDKKVIRRMYGDIPGAAGTLIALLTAAEEDGRIG